MCNCNGPTFVLSMWVISFVITCMKTRKKIRIKHKTQLGKQIIRNINQSLNQD